MPARIWPGQPFPLGATYDGMGVNFALFSENAERVELCLFTDVDDRHERERIELPEVTAHVFHGYLPRLRPGQLYGYRVYGPWRPKEGLLFNGAKLLVDPYAQAIANDPNYTAGMYGHVTGAAKGEMLPDPADNAWGAPKCVVVDNVFDWQNDYFPRTPWRDTIIYEAHVKGLTARHPDVPETLRGTYSGIASDAVIAHLTRLGITAIELMPVHEIADEPRLVSKGLKNNWGYNSLGYFAPAGRYGANGRRGEQVAEFKAMVRRLHRANIEVILDVVYNHTGEGDHTGPMLSFKGIDNPTYYRLRADDRSRYVDYTGCGNSLNVQHPQTLKLIMDSLRYWVTEMHIDGFRFDLAATLARELHDVDRLSSFFDIIHQDPILSRTKLIAEPWDLGAGGYQVGNFPVLWTEWNGKYRDSVRRFWKGDSGVVGELGFRLTGSADLYASSGRRPSASINFVVCHDGFTLEDLVSYETKHNEANGENNRDGTDANYSANYGVEGPTDDPAILDVRERQKRNLLTTLFVSQGVPMFCAGDEIGRTQRGNNNAYCQDNELSWVDWTTDDRKAAVLAFVERLAKLRRSEPVLRRKRFLTGARVGNSALKDVTWLMPSGDEMTYGDWSNPDLRAFGMLLGGDALPTLDDWGERVRSSSILLLVNGGTAPVEFTLPSIAPAERWELLLDTRSDTTGATPASVAEARRYALVARSSAVLKLAIAAAPAPR